MAMIKLACEQGAFIFIMDCIKHVFEMAVSKSRYGNDVKFTYEETGKVLAH